MPAVKKTKTEKPQKATSSGESKVQPSERVISGQLKKKILKKKQTHKKVERGVVLVKHLPHGFYEEQLRRYFQQFGRVTRLRLARSTRTGGSRGFAFVEFEYPEVAKVAAETMHNYLMFKKVVKASYIPPEEQKFNYFKSTVRKVKNKVGKEIFISGKTASIQRRVKEQNDWTDEIYQKRTDASLKKLEKLKKKYAHLNLDFSNVLVGPKEQQEHPTVSETAATNNKLKRKATKGETIATSEKQIKTAPATVVKQKKEKDAPSVAQKKEKDTTIVAQKKEKDTPVVTQKKEKGTTIAAQKKETVVSAVKQKKESIASDVKQKKETITPVVKQKKETIAPVVKSTKVEKSVPIKKQTKVKKTIEPAIEPVQKSLKVTAAVSVPSKKVTKKPVAQVSVAKKVKKTKK